MRSRRVRTRWRRALPTIRLTSGRTPRSPCIEAGRSVEKGDSNDARKKASEAESKFRKSELTAIRVDLLGAARQAREAAQEADAEEKAPRTYAEGVQALAAAESTLKGDRYQRAEAKDHAKAATAAFQHATYIAGVVDRVAADNPEEFEKLQRQHDMSELQNLFDSDQASVIRQGDASTR